MKRVGIIDIGSNSVRLIIVELQNSINFKVIYELKQAIRLGKDMGKDNSLESARINRAVSTISTFKTICHSMNTEKIIAVATEAVRRASNKQKFLDSVKLQTGIDVRVLSGDEEAYYDYIGVINSMNMADCLLIDIGGSSTEFILVRNSEAIHSISIPYGSISLTEIYNTNPENFKNWFNSILDKISWLKAAYGYPIIGIGGTFRNIGKIDRKRKIYPIDNAHNYLLLNTDLEIIVNNTIDKVSGKIKKIKGLSNDRSDIFIGPVYAVNIITDYCNTGNIYISGSGVREGLIFEHVLGHGEKLDNILDYSLQNIMFNFDIDSSHAFKVYQLTTSLFSQLKHLACQNINPENIIKTAALLHDAGIKINFYDHHKHTFYSIINSRINGLTHKELLMAAFVAALHRKDEFRIDLIKYKDLINQSDALFIQQIGILLKICEKLDIKMDGNVQNIVCSFYEDSIIIKLISEDSVDMEIESAMACKNTFKRLFNKKLMLV